MRWVLVTGGSRGIGAAIATRLRTAGYNVAITYRQAAQQAEELAQRLTTESGWCKAYQCDVMDQIAVNRLAEQLIATLGAPYAVINNAGQYRDALLMNMTPDNWRAVIDTNLNGVFYVTRAFLNSMLVAGDGCLLSLSSISALRGNPGQTNYAASKAALVGFTKALTHEVSRFNLRVNAIAPGIVETEMTANIIAEHEKKLRKWIPLRRIGTPDDVALMVEFLLGPGGRYVTGQCIAVDGGLSA